MFQRTLAMSLLTVIAALPACGNDVDDKQATTATPAAKKELDPTLSGRWNATVPLSEIPDLQAGPGMPLGPRWAIELVSEGGAARTLRYENLRAGVSGGYSYKVAGDRITVRDMNCSSGPAKTVFSYVVDGDELRFETVRNPCADHVFEDLLTARAWHRG